MADGRLGGEGVGRVDESSPGSLTCEDVREKRAVSGEGRHVVARSRDDEILSEKYDCPTWRIAASEIELVACFGCEDGRSLTSEGRGIHLV